MNAPLSAALQEDISSVQRIPAVPTILDVVCRITGMGFAAVARVTDEHWIACSVKDTLNFGLVPGGELELRSTICHEIRQHRTPVVIDDVSKSAEYCSHHTPAKYGLQSYISVPIVLPDGEFFGTLCAIDPRPARVETPEVINTFNLFAELIAFHLDAQRRVENSEQALLAERETSHLREQFIAVLGHDLRNPLNSIASASSVLDRMKLDAPAVGMVAIVQRSVRRMATLIDDVLDFARGRLGGGLSVKRSSEPLTPVLEQVVAELQLAFPERVIDTTFDLPPAVDCDRTRIAQMFSNLLANALTYGTPEAPIRVRARVMEGSLEIEVANQGEPIAPTAMARLFHPFERGAVKPSQQGLGLGLYISSEIARAHGGTLGATSDETGTRFTARLPLASDTAVGLRYP